MADEPDSRLDGALLQLGEHAGKLTAIDGRHKEIGRAILTIQGTAASQHEILRNLDGIDRMVAEVDARVRNLAARPDPKDESDAYEPMPTVCWWKADTETREEAVTRLGYWVSKIFVPGYGKLASVLPACWDQHEFILYTLDWLSELWSVLYLTEERTANTVAAQGEFQTRILAAASDQIAKEVRGCTHGPRAAQP